MKVPYSWLKEYVDIDVSPEELEDKLFSCGFEVEEMIRPGAEISKVVVCEVKSCEKVEGTHLVICKVDCGSFGGDIQIVTGAPNVYEGMHTPAALDGATLPGGVRIAAKPLKGIPSNGLENDSIERHDLYIRHDQTYPTKVDELEYIGHATNSRLWFDTETKGTLYTIPTKEMGDRIYHQLGKVIAQYYKDHPYDIHFGLSVIPPTYDQWKWEVNLVRSQVYDYTKREDTPHEYRITFYPPGNKWDGVCRILVEETDGYLWLPKGWRNMKSWINGKAIYYKK